MEHTLACKKGGLIIARHDYLKFKLANLLNDALPSNHIRIEPKLQLSENMKEKDRLVGDATVRDI